MLGYHFTGHLLRDGCRIPPRYTRAIYYGPVVPCESGLHASEHPYDALQYAPGPRLHRVELVGDLVSHGDPIDKWAGRERTILATIDATELLREFARWCAMQVVHLWDAPDVVREFLATGNKSLRAAAAAASVAWAAAADWAAMASASAANAAASAANAAAADWAADADWATRAACASARAAAAHAANAAAADRASLRRHFGEMVAGALP